MTLNLYSKRFTIAKGWHWRLERECMESVAQDWLNVYEADEPKVIFVVARNKPKI